MLVTTSPPRLAVTLGDAAGIGPEILARALLEHPELRTRMRPVVIGDVGALRRGVRAVGLDEAAVVTIEHPDDATNDPALIEVLQTGPDLSGVPVGEMSAEAGDGAYRFVVEACRLAKEGAVDAIVTPPLNKAAMHLAGHAFPGHTELLAHEFGVSNYSLVLSAGELSIFHLTTHLSLSDAIAGITPARVDGVLSLVHAYASSAGRVGEPIGVAGLNPHAGENGLFGHEDDEILRPAVERAVAAGIPARGPIAADALIPEAVRGKWRFVVACYHDQGHAPFKAVYGHEGVNITVGLPVVRVSVDHGTAFDIAGRGVAGEGSLVLAMTRAAELAPGWDLVWQAAQRSAEALQP